MATTNPSFTGYDWALLIGLLVSLVVAASSAAAETALTSISHIRMRNLAEEGDVKAQRIRRILEHPDTFLSTILVVSNLSVITSSTLATLIALDTHFQFAEVASTILLSVIVLIFCEITPKTAAVQNPERVARLLLRPVELASSLLRPVVFGLTAITSGLLRALGMETRRRGPFLTEDELRLMVEVGEEEGVLEEEEREMIHNVFDLGDTAVREVMVPRIDMVTVEADEPLDEATAIIIQGGFSRVPVFDDTINDIIGVLYAKDLLRILATGQKVETIRQLPLRGPYFVPESKRLDDLLHEMQRQRVHMAIVVDEYGAVVGLATIEDLVEEIIGDIKDEYDKEEPVFERVSENEFLVDAKISVDELNDLIDANLPTEDYDTLGGFVYTQLDKIPSVGDEVRFEDLTITVLGAKGRRITKVKIVREHSSDAGGPGERAERGRESDRGRDSRDTRDPGDSHDGREGRDRADRGADARETRSGRDNSGAERSASRSRASSRQR